MKFKVPAVIFLLTISTNVIAAIVGNSELRGTEINGFNADFLERPEIA